MRGGNSACSEWRFAVEGGDPSVDVVWGNVVAVGDPTSGGGHLITFVGLFLVFWWWASCVVKGRAEGAESLAASGQYINTCA